MLLLLRRLIGKSVYPHTDRQLINQLLAFLSKHLQFHLLVDVDVDLFFVVELRDTYLPLHLHYIIIYFINTQSNATANTNSTTDEYFFIDKK